MPNISKFIIGETTANIKDALSRQLIGNLENLQTESKDSIVSALNEVDTIVKSIQGSIYPIGHYIFNDECDTESKVINLYGGSHWVQVKDKFIIASGDTYTTDGGSATKTLSENNLPAHKHNVNGNFTTGNESAGHTHSFTTGNESAGHTHSFTTGGAGEHNHTFSTTTAQSAGSTWMPQIYAGPSAGSTQTNVVPNHTHSGTTNANGSSHTHSLSINHDTTTVGSGEAFDIMPPYTPTYIWRRVE